MTSPEASGRRPARGRRRWFLAALAMFFAWVAVLGALALLSGRRPPDQAANARAAP
ncbi:MAG: hypothetical protein ABI353_08085 [Isosphaeraceae bacterium]